jgi:hypothetical protein
MKINEILSEGNVLDFPTKDVKRSKMLDRLASASSSYHANRELIKQFTIFDPAGKSYGDFETYEEAEKALPEIMMKSGKRGLHII